MHSNLTTLCIVLVWRHNHAIVDCRRRSRVAMFIKRQSSNGAWLIGRTFYWGIIWSALGNHKRLYIKNWIIEQYNNFFVWSEIGFIMELSWKLNYLSKNLPMSHKINKYRKYHIPNEHRKNMHSFKEVI